MTGAEPVRFGPVQLARLLGLPEPTAEQAAVIGAPLRPGVVVAGAGSGKSETMAARVVWLVANGLVRPEQVLGLTFTRKAAAELAHRVRTRLDQLKAAKVLPPTPSGEEGSPDVLDGEPTVSTYHAYAGRLVADHALREAVEPSARLITPAVEWQLASRVVADYDGPMDAVPWAPATVTSGVLELGGELAEHLRDGGEVRELGDRLRAEADALPGRVPAATAALLRAQRAREQLLPMIERYAKAKAAREVMDHGDRVALAARIARGHAEVGRIERERFQVVLLDEYQDTSHAQLVLLRALFGGGHPVTAVGDPCQSIYGWRGASAGNLLRFPGDFPAADGEPAPVGQLATSFRNGERVLDVAKVLAEDLRAEAAAVPVLHPGGARRGRGAVACALFATADDEAEWIAAQIAAALDLPGGIAPDGRPWTDERDEGRRVRPADVAVLCRKRGQFAPIRAALRRRGIPVEVVGLGGLLTVPEVSDIVATLRMLHDAGAGDALARLLTGPRWRLGPRDLVALGNRARELARQARRDLDGARLPEPVDEPDPLRQAVADMTAEVGSLIDALDDPGDAEGYSEAGYDRLLRLGAELRMLRRQAAQPLPDLINEVERVLGLDIEVAARPGREPVSARADLDALVDAASRFAGSTEDPTLGAFLAYLAAAQDQEFGLEAGRVGESDSVKLMTVHAAKGLQWPLVVVPGLSSGRRGTVFPARPRTSTRWNDNPRKLPFPLRGDAGDLPVLAGVDADALAEFTEACALRDQREERRLAYVAVTRASFGLLCSGYWWGDGAARLGPSVFLDEVRAACLAGAGRVVRWEAPPGEDAENPRLAEPKRAPWPAAPGGAVHAGVVEGADLVRSAGWPLPHVGAAGGADGGEVRAATAGELWLDRIGRATLPPGMRRRLDGWERDVELLLAHREAQRDRDGVQLVELPGHLSVSSLVTLARDPEELARQIRRPMPRPPAPYARRGTAFHRWLETRFGQQELLEPDQLPGAADDGAADDGELAELREAFERGAWASRVPIEVEVPFETMLGDRLVRGRIDAVFAETGDDGQARFDVVDWKTGPMPATGAERRAVSVQLAAYRLAWADLARVPVERVGAAFHYVRFDTTVRPSDLLDGAALRALLEELPAAE
ncbi:ATP-dependent DNA helicase [Allonocardiopsis opalescens]|uniref:DNA 3'-5' helicase n=1 Tax=Allonocardiopsis opalescens TaxID=1144618 RepID=A0A2T0QDG8_9ACTN|nr:ATP-dependent DNA helicase [Allonocardiopsis opalescens]PRY01996.1 DNA helicase-2/ATP-dependent DNA helicase PcrA [Allonocardiopsis opalescens]